MSSLHQLVAGWYLRKSDAAGQGSGHDTEDPQSQGQCWGVQRQLAPLPKPSSGVTSRMDNSP